MRRRQERGWLRFSDPTIDPDLTDEWLGRVTVWMGGTADAYWTHLLEYDVHTFIKVRRRMKLFLARYGRQSLLQWGDVETTEIVDWFNDLIEMMKGEGISEEAAEVMSGD